MQLGKTLWILSTYKFLKNVVFLVSERLKMRSDALAEGKLARGQYSESRPQARIKRFLVMAQRPLVAGRGRNLGDGRKSRAGLKDFFRSRCRAQDLRFR